MLSLGGGYFPAVKNWSIETTAAIEFIDLDEPEFEEMGAGAVNLDVQSRNTQSSFVRLGLNATRDYQFKYGKIVPEFGATYIRNIEYKGRDITASFTDYPDAAFTVEGLPLADNCIAINLGLGIFTLNGFAFELSYMGEWYDSCQSKNFALKVGRKF
ncbi:MAG TPA: hypothetical protein DDW65_05665 [Firmicutes bacterium]|jgi:uncharacterized protein with beta-barrel porin domain|nr:hypothetical protein [Bacillota bacterium]